MFMLAEPLTEAEQTLKEKYISQGFPDWARRDYQQFIKALENYGWYAQFYFLLPLGPHIC